MEIYVASLNPGKLKEFANYFEKDRNYNFSFKSLQELPTDTLEQYNPVENADSFLKNALIKAKTAYDLIKKPIISEDSGLEVEALNGRPGIHSSRYADTDQKRVERLLAEMEPFTKENRRARFVSTFCFIDSLGNSVFFHGKVEGYIALKQSGKHGFGYDPIFYHEPSGTTFAELSIQEKQNVSHRGMALKSLFSYLKKLNKEK